MSRKFQVKEGGGGQGVLASPNSLVPPRKMILASALLETYSNPSSSPRNMIPNKLLPTNRHYVPPWTLNHW